MLQDRVAQMTSGARELPARPFGYSPEFAPGVVRVLEVALIAAAGLASWLWPEFHRPEYLSQHVFCVVFVTLLYNHLADWASLYQINALMRPLAQADNVVVAVAAPFAFLLAVIFGLDVGYFFAPEWFAVFAGGSILGVLLVRFASFQTLKTLSRRRVIGRNLVVLGDGAQCAQFVRKMERDPPYFTTLAGVFSDGDAAGQTGATPMLGGVNDLLDYARRGLVDDVVVAMAWSDDRRVTAAIETLKELPVNVYVGSDLVGFDLSFRPVLGVFSQLPVFEVVQRPISGWGSALKKALDYTVATVALVGLSPLLLLIAAAIKLDSPGPVFFLQQRLGFNNKPFSIYKFRSMRHGCGREAVVTQATRGDPRVTRVGRIIRATSLDELPQLFNVLNGTMSLVGPRPHALSHNEEYGSQIRGYFARHKVKPGITGWAQVNGLRGETAELETMRKRIEHDVYYAENWSLLFDVKILVMTALVVLFQKAAY